MEVISDEQQLRALANYEKFNMLPVGSATIGQVAATSGGVKAWAEATAFDPPNAVPDGWNHEGVTPGAVVRLTLPKGGLEIGAEVFVTRCMSATMGDLLEVRTADHKSVTGVHVEYVEVVKRAHGEGSPQGQGDSPPAAAGGAVANGDGEVVVPRTFQGSSQGG